MRRTGFFLALAGLLTAVCRADFLQFAAELPTCALSCMLQELPLSDCKVATNFTCICTDDGLTNAVQTCLLSNCTTLEALTVARIDDQACDKPIRNQRGKLWAMLPIDIIVFIFIGLRLFSRFNSGQGFRLDDYAFVIVAAIWAPFVTLGEYVSLTGLGVDIWTLDTSIITQALRLFFVAETLYLIVLSGCKLIILTFFLEVFPAKMFRIAVFITMGWIMAATMILVFFQIFQCSPINYNWDGWQGTITDYHCVDVNVLSYTAAAFSIAEDVVILILPLPELISLKTSLRKKINIIIMFSLGIFILVTSSIRLRYLVQFAKSTNPTWDYTDTVMWTSLEINVSMIVVCLPPIRALLVHFKILGGSTVDNKSAGYSGNKKSTLQSSKLSKVSQSRLSRNLTNGAIRLEDDVESHIELGDRQKGNTQWEVGTGGTFLDDPSKSELEDEQGIHVVKSTILTHENFSRPRASR